VKSLSIPTVLAALALALAACTTAADDPTPEPPLELSAGEGNAMMSCLAFDPAVLAEMSLAFEGTAAAVDGERVALTVDRWFKGGEATDIVLLAPAGFEALIDGITFEVGEHYLISATDGTVNYCGFSGEVTPELTAGFEAAFGD
jgi:hypothetical protein